jgi:putative endonuclease
MYTVYFLYSQKLDRYYVGYTNDLPRRFSEHNRRKGKYTDMGLPWIVVHTEDYISKKEAQEREKAIKRRKSKQAIIDIINNR